MKILFYTYNATFNSNYLNFIMSCFYIKIIFIILFYVNLLINEYLIFLYNKLYSNSNV